MTIGRFESAGAMHTSSEMMWTFGLLDSSSEVDIAPVSDYPEVEIDANRRS
ncbi:MAG: hypothetical protein V3U86_09900 [Acidobacteriota bacterium]